MEILAYSNDHIFYLCNSSPACLQVNHSAAELANRFAGLTKVKNLAEFTSLVGSGKIKQSIPFKAF